MCGCDELFVGAGIGGEWISFAVWRERVRGEGDLYGISFTGFVLTGVAVGGRVVRVSITNHVHATLTVLLTELSRVFSVFLFIQVCDICLHQEPMGGPASGGASRRDVCRVLGSKHVPRWCDRAPRTFHHNGETCWGVSILRVCLCVPSFFSPSYFFLGACPRRVYRCAPAGVLAKYDKSPLQPKVHREGLDQHLKAPLFENGVSHYLHRIVSG